MLKNKDIICFGPSDWWGMNPSCTTHIMRHLAEANRVLYVNPVSSDLLGVRTRKGLGRRILRKLKSMAKFVRRGGDNLFILSPLFFPMQGNVLIDAMNNLLLKFQLRAVMFFIRMQRPILWVENIRAADVMRSISRPAVIYHVSDRFDRCPYTRNKDKVMQRESVVTDQSDRIICVSRKLYEWKKPLGSKVHYLPHGVDFELFRAAADGSAECKLLAGVPRPIAGYFGTLTAENDIELLTYCCTQNPDISFVFAGQITAGDYSGLSKLPNVFFLGRLPYEQIPGLCVNFDVCMLPWKVNEWIISCNPLKLLEYMASGKPIVSVYIDEIAAKYSDVLTVASNMDEFSKGIRYELDNDSETRKNARIEIARKHSWNEHAKRLSEIIEQCLMPAQTPINDKRA
jgi:glycosyltransferase involved in cell wall biosynthesis